MEYTLPYTFQVDSKLFCRQIINNYPEDIPRIKTILTDLIKASCSMIYSFLPNRTESIISSLLTISGITSVTDLERYIVYNTSSEPNYNYINNILIDEMVMKHSFLEDMISHNLDIQSVFDPQGHEWKYPYYLTFLFENNEFIDLPAVMFYYEYPQDQIISIFQSSTRCLNTPLIETPDDVEDRLMNQITTYDLWTEYMIKIRDIIDSELSSELEINEALSIYNCLMEYALF
jgi:hypothetical protein